MLPVLKTLMSAAWARGKGPKQIVKARSVAPAKAILIAFPQSLVWNSPGAEITRADEGGKVLRTSHSTQDAVMFGRHGPSGATEATVRKTTTWDPFKGSA
jgi:hypothetical protein